MVRNREEPNTGRRRPAVSASRKPLTALVPQPMHTQPPGAFVAQNYSSTRCKRDARQSSEPRRKLNTHQLKQAHAAHRRAEVAADARRLKEDDRKAKAAPRRALNEEFDHLLCKRQVQGSSYLIHLVFMACTSQGWLAAELMTLLLLFGKLA